MSRTCWKLATAADNEYGTYKRHLRKMNDQCTLDSRQSIMGNTELAVAGMSKERN